MSQATLFDDVKLSIQERFELFLDANPVVYDLFKRFAREARGKGHKRFSADAICHRIRWHCTVEIVRVEGEEFRLNDHFTSRLARKLREEEPGVWDGFFEFRELREAKSLAVGGRRIACS